MTTKLKFGFDCDDCIMDTLSSLQRVALEKYNLHINKPRSFDLRKLGISEDVIQDIITTALNDWLNLQPVPGAIDFLRKYAEFCDELIFITYRGNWVEKEKTTKWIEYWLPGVNYKVHFPKNEIPKSIIVKNENINAFVEDRFSYALNVSDVCDYVFLMNKPWNEDREHNRNNIIRVNGWSDIHSFVFQN